ncbi:MAG: hypothetical protein DRQ47_01670 [Gammaproteobacteria bacterium]|nr:MAG: hypothetical protein DRQ47_01670 [Gammaproteobacteria bacterium]
MELTGGTPPQFDVHAMIESYNKGQLSKQQIDEFNQAILTPPLKGMLIDFQGETFTDRVRAEQFDVLGILAKSLPISLIEQGLVGKKNVTNTPILTINTHADPLVPLIESQLVTDASTHGKLMIYDNYEGHCVSRKETVVIINWLSKYLKLNSIQK